MAYIQYGYNRYDDMPRVRTDTKTELIDVPHGPITQGEYSPMVFAFPFLSPSTDYRVTEADEHRQAMDAIKNDEETYWTTDGISGIL